MKNVVSVALGVLVIGAFIDSCSCYCSPDWVHYNHSCYKFEDQIMTFNDAKEYCANNGGYLVKIDDGFENAFLKAHAKEINAVWSRWIGLEDISGTWRWVSDNTPATYTDWWPLEPNASHEMCAMLSTAYNFQWNDANCTHPYYATRPLCEKQDDCQCSASCSCGGGGN